MVMGIFIGFLTIAISLFINYLILFKFVYPCSRDFEDILLGDKVKHWTITYYVSWIIALIPFVGFFIEVLWLSYYLYNYRCNSILFRER